MNKWVLMGRLCKDPEISFYGDNKAVAKFPIAVDRRFKKDGEAQTDFFGLTAFGKTAEFCEKYLKKGIKVLCECEVRNNNYTDKEGKQVYGFQFVITQIEFAESKRAAESSGASTQNEPQETEGEFMQIDDSISDALPFA